MHYPVTVFTGKVRKYEGSRPSAIAKVQVDGELTLTELGLAGDQQAEKKIHGGPDRALCHYPREHYQHWKTEFPEQADLFVAPAFGENLSTEGLTEKNVFIGDRSPSRARRASNLTTILAFRICRPSCKTRVKPAGCIALCRRDRFRRMRRLSWLRA